MAQAAFDPARIYSSVEGEPFPVRAIDLRRVNPHFYRTVVGYDAPEKPGTIVIDPENHFLYLTQEDGSVIRYGVGRPARLHQVRGSP